MERNNAIPETYIKPECSQETALVFLACNLDR